MKGAVSIWRFSQVLSSAIYEDIVVLLLSQHVWIVTI
jgi:hypothetical protein